MNYRHGYHAGNFADVLKHVALVELLHLLMAKDKGLLVVDTHAGAGGYDLTSGFAQRTVEAEGGIRRLEKAARTGMPRAVARYLDAVLAYERKFGASNDLRHYPGSPRVIRSLLRSQDRFVACELHPQDSLALKREFAGDRAIDVRQADGYQTLKALLPPPERRGLILIDPPFEVTDEFERLARALRQALRRFATGCYAIWYPIKDTAAEDFVRSLGDLKTIVLEVHLEAMASTGKLAACGVAVVNPPWKFEEAMREALPWIAARLGPDVRTVVRVAPANVPAPAPTA